MATVDRRKFRRFKLSTPLTGFVEHNHRRYSGQVIDLSFGGFCVEVPYVDHGVFSAFGEADFGEVFGHDKAMNVFGFGHIISVRETNVGAAIGFRWDADLCEDFKRRLADIIHGQVKRKSAGYVAKRDRTIFLGGHVSAALEPEVEILGGTNTPSVLSLADATSIDHSGIEMLATMANKGTVFRDASAQVAHDVSHIQYLLVA